MNLVLIAAVVAVCSAAKLDRTYLPPPSAKTAGGSAGSLQTPFAGNSFNQGLGNFPKGSFTNDFQGVVVDAAAPGTRASESATGLGAPRPSYGSTNSKVGDAAFRGDAGFRFGTTQAADEEENLDSDVQAANNRVAGVPQRFGANSQQFEAKPERSQAAYDRVANTLRYVNEVGPDGYHYAFETDNGISAEENGVATNGVQAQGGYSYTGDDGQVYSVTYTADEGGYQPRGDHLPTPPPIPVEILKSLEQNARDEAAGLVDDGSYDAQRYNAGADYAESDITNEEQNNRRAPSFGRRPESDATASGSFISQNNQAFVKPNLNELPSQKEESSNVRDSTNSFGPSIGDSSFAQASQSNSVPMNQFGSRNEYRPSGQGFKQNGRPQRPNAAPVNKIQQSSEDQENNPQYQSSQEGQGSQPSLPFGGSNRSPLETQGFVSNEKPSRNNGRIQPSRNSISSATAQFGNRFASSNEYLPPVRGQPARPQRPTFAPADAIPEQSFNQVSEAEIQATGQIKPTSDFSQDFSSQTNVGVPVSQSTNNFQQKPQGFNNQFSQSANRFPTMSGKGSNDKPSDITSFETQRPTSLPSTELTTPLESNEELKEDLNESSEREAAPVSANSFNAQNFNARPSSQISGQSFNKQPTHSVTNSQSKPTNADFPSRSQYSFQSGNQKYTGLSQNVPNDAQFSPSTIRPSFNQQPQGADDAYYYRQPAKPFNTPINSFPSTSSGQFNGLNQQTQNQYSDNSQQNFPESSFQPQRGQPNRGSTRYPEPPTLAPVSPTASISGQFQGSTTSSQYNGITQASASPFQSQNGQSSTKYPRPPTLAPTVPTTPLGGFPSHQNGITQASALGFTPGAPTVPTSFSTPTFSARPAFQTQFQQNQFQSSQDFIQRQPQSNDNNNQADNSQTTPTQQYSGEIYDYSKPAESFPASAKPAATASPQRGQPQSQFGQTQDNRNAEEYSAQPTRPSFGSRPQFGAQRPQYSQNAAGDTQDQPADGTNSQFNLQSRPIGKQPQRPQASRPQFSQNNGRPNCCKSLDAQISKLEAQRPVQGPRPVRPQFAQAESQFSGPISQGSSQAFAGRGEVFGGPRKPPSFDSETGYHY